MEQENREPAAAAAIQGDILESILSFVPLIDLAPAMHVSKEWKLAVTSSLLYLNPSKPWLFIHQRNTHFPDSISTLAFDTRSKSWMQIHRPAPPCIPTGHLRSSHSGLLYTMSPSTLSLSSDPFHLKWHHFRGGPLRWRPDPIVALVGGKVVVAGGGGGEAAGTDTDTDPLAVEIHDVNTGCAEPGDSIPAGLKESAALTWVSTATDGRILYVMEKETGKTHTFDSESNSWTSSDERGNDLFLCPDRTGFNYMITFAHGRLILIGLMGGDSENASGLKVWSVNPENFVSEEIGEMPKTMFERMKEESFQMSSIKTCSAGSWVYIYNPCEIGDVYICELMGGGAGGCRWTLERVPVMNGRRSWQTVAVTCSEVGICDVQEGLRSEKWTCVPTTMSI